MLAALAWWTVLLLKFNSVNHTLAQTADQSEYTAEAIQDYEKNKLMIMGEGLVFAVALVTGVYLLYRSYKRELETSSRQNNFLMSVTHELKTPLSVMKLSNETMRMRDLDTSTQAKLLDIDRKEINRLELLINNLLLSSKLDQSRLFNSRFSDRIQFQADSKISMQVDKHLFSTAIDNLLDNALRYSEGQVSLELHELNNTVKISVIDNGKGIPKGEREKIFEKFYRIGDENVRSTQGTGLGLFLSKSIIEAHQGSIQVSDNVPTGTIFTISINRR